MNRILVFAEDKKTLLGFMYVGYIQDYKDGSYHRLTPSKDVMFHDWENATIYSTVELIELWIRHIRIHRATTSPNDPQKSPRWARDGINHGETDRIYYLIPDSKLLEKLQKCTDYVPLEGEMFK